MNNRDNFKIDVISGIDEEIIDRSTKERIRLIDKPRLSFRKRIMAFGSMAAMIIAVFGVVLFFALNGVKQIPVYTGMSVSSSNPALESGSGLLPSQSSGASTINNGNNGNHYGHYKGDHVKDDDDINRDDPFGKGDNALEDALDSNISATPGSDMYYAGPGEDIFITIHIDNPDKFEILSFTLNGEKYTSYMFEYGSNIENLILKVNVGNVEGVQEYTIDQIKYVDGTEIKDVKMEGDRTVKIGVSTSKQPTVTVSNFLATLNSISFKVNINDELDLIKKSNGKIQAVLYDGESIVAIKDISESGQSVVFDSLNKNTLYQYGILITYDDLSGEGTKSFVNKTDAVYTQNPLLFDEVDIGKTGISFKYKWYTDLAEKTLVSVSLMKGGEKVRDIDISALTIDGLLSNNEYSLVAEYKMDNGTESIRLDFTTKAKDIPSFTVNEVSKTQTSIKFDISETDVDNTGEISKIEILHGNDEPIVLDSLELREITNLLSNNTYTVKITYLYDLNDGEGEKEGTSSFDITTEAKAVPKISFSNQSLANNIFKCDYTVIDPDNLATVRSVKLYSEKTEIGNAPISGSVEFTLPDNDSICTVRITYEYDLNDGTGVHTAEADTNAVVPSKGLATENGMVVGIGTCEDTVLYINLPVAPNAFKDNLNIEKVYLVSGATSVGYSAFQGCLKLGYVYIGDGVTALSDTAFDDCAGLTKIYVSSTVRSLGSFNRCTNLREIIFEEGSELTAIGGFMNCTALKSINIPDGITSINSYAFYYSGIEYISFGENSGLTTVGTGAFANCMNLKGIDLPNSVTTIENDAFACCTSLKSILIPGTVATIGSGVFSVCNELTIYTDAAEIPSGWSKDMNPDKRPIVLDAKESSYTFEANGGSAVDVFTGVLISSPPASVRNGYYLIGWYDNSEFKGAPVKFPYYSNEKTTLYARWLYLEGNSISEGFEMKNGVISGIGSCSDTVLYIDQPIQSEAFKNNTSIKKVYLLSGVSQIGDRAFEGCTGLEYVYICEGITSVRDGAFKNCTGLTEVNIPSTVENIHVHAFYGCTKLTDVNFAEDSQLTVIWTEAFAQCSSLKSISLPDNLTTISYGVFSNCGLESIHFGENSKLTSIGSSAFANCTNLKEFYVPKSVMKIDLEAFWYCDSLKTVVIPQTVVSVGKNAFISFNDFIIFTDASEWPSLWDATVKDNSSQVVYNAKENEYTFNTNGGSSIDPITGYVIGTSPETTRDGYVFGGWYDNAELSGEQISFPYASGEKTILYAKWLNEYIFETNGGSSVENIKDLVVNDAPIPTKDGYAFDGWFDNPELNGNPVSFPYSNSEKTTLYAKWIYLNGASLSEGFEIENGMIVGIGSCQDTVLYINQPVASNAFLNNTNIEKVYLLYGATEVKMSAFGGCLRLQQVYIGNGVEKIGPSAFGGCISLTDIYVSSTLKELGSISGCSNLKKVEFAEGSQLTYFGGFTNCTSLEGTFVVPDGVTCINTLAFADTKIQYVVFGENSQLTTIMHGAFSNCRFLKTIKLPESVTTIDDFAFNWCSSLTSIYIPGTVSSIAEEVFGNCSNLTIFTDATSIPEGWSSAMNPSNRPIVLDAKEISFSFVTNGGSAVEGITGMFIPEAPKTVRDGYFVIGWYDNAELSGEPVKFPYYNSEKTTLYAKWYDLGGKNLSEGLEIENGVIVGKGTCTDTELYINLPIGNDAFKDNTSIEKVFLFNEVSNVGFNAFRGCTNLTYVYIGEGVEAIYQNAFQDCTSLEEVYIGSTVTSIGDSTFRGCSKLETVTFAENSKLTYISMYLFYGCSSLKVISIPDNVTTIDKYAFDGTGLESVNFGEGCKLTTIGESAFQSCNNLKVFIVPESVLTINSYAFWSCTALKVIVIPKSVLSIGSGAIISFYDYTIYTDAAEWPSSWNADIKPDSNSIVYNAKINQYTFESNGGSTIDGITDYVIFNNQIPKKDGCLFLGWYDNSEFEGSVVKFPYYSSEKTILCAKWLDTNNFTESEGLEKDGSNINGIGECQDKMIKMNSPVNAYSFINCTGISTLIFGEGVTSIGELAFIGCTDIVNVVFTGDTMPELGDGVFSVSWDNYDFRIYVPEAAYEQFASYEATWWQDEILGYDRLVAY